ELEGVERRLGELRGKMSDPTAPLESIMAAVSATEKRRDELRGELEKLRAESATATPLAEAHGVLKLLARAGESERLVLRRRLRSYIAELVETIYLKPEKHLGRVYGLVQIHFRGDRYKQVIFGPGIGDSGNQT